MFYLWPLQTSQNKHNYINSIHRVIGLILNTFPNVVWKCRCNIYNVFGCLIICWHSVEQWLALFVHEPVPKLGPTDLF